jgi:hypothetical protein
MRDRYRTEHPIGLLPAGMTVEVITLTGAHTGGNGQWLLVKYPNGVRYAMVRTVEELEDLGITGENLQEVAR